MPLPVIQVSRLSSASSFYAAITQPLNIRYLTTLPALPAPHPAPSSVSASSHPIGTAHHGHAHAHTHEHTLTFGTADTREPLFQLRQVAPTPDQPLRTSRLVFAANSVDAVHAFHALALKANPKCAAVVGTRASLDSDSTTVIGAVIAAATAWLDSSDVCARVTDLDGNTMEIAYWPSSYSYSSYRGSSPSRHRQFANDDSGRILHWSYDSPPPDVSYESRPARYPDMPGYSYYSYDAVSPSSSSTRYHASHGSSLRRSVTSTSAVKYGLSSSSSSSSRHAGLTREHSGSKSGSSGNGTGSGSGSGRMAGMLGMAAVGAAAGAALTYSVMRSSSRSRSRSSRDCDYDEVTAVPSFQRRSTFPDPYPSYDPPRYSSQEGMRASSRKGSRAFDDLYEYGDSRSRYTPSRAYRMVEGGAVSGGSRARGHSETPVSRAPLLLHGDDTYRSSSRRGSAAGAPAPAPAPAPLQRSATYDYGVDGDHGDRGERHSHVSAARSHRTVRGSERSSSNRMQQASTPPNASRSAPVRHGLSRAASYISPHNVPLPASGVGSSHARYDVPQYGDSSRDGEDDDPILFDDCDSIAPSDSISCVGSRSRYH